MRCEEEKTIILLETIMKKINEPTTAKTDSLRPEFIRLPKSGHTCPFTGLSRTSLNELIMPTERNGHRPPVRSYSVCKEGQSRGVRLIEFESLASYVRNQAKAV